MFEFVFKTGAVNLHSIDLFDTSKGKVSIEMFDSQGLIASFINDFDADTNDNINNNLFGTVNFGNVMNVNSMKVTLDGVSGAIDNVVISPVPEPSTYAMMIAGLGFVSFMIKKKSKTK